jgi:hypothetical protein
MLHANFSVDRLEELLKCAEPQWHSRQIIGALCEEDWGDGSFPKFKDIQTVADIHRIGAAGLKMRFREVDPAIWDWLFEKLGEVA